MKKPNQAKQNNQLCADGMSHDFFQPFSTPQPVKITDEVKLICRKCAESRIA